MNGRPWTHAEVKRLKALLDDKTKTQAEIGTLLGRTRIAVQLKAYLMGWGDRRKRGAHWRWHGRAA